MKTLFLCFGLVVVGAVLTGCGQKGPLYLPTDGTPMVDTAPASDDPNDY
ncbi:lipoprotein [Moraxella sp. ZJ142]